MLCLQVVLVLSGGEAPWSSTAERRPLPHARGPLGSPCAGLPPPDLLAADPVDDFDADGGDASDAADGAGWRLFGVRGSTTSRPLGGFFRSKASGKMQRRRVIGTSCSSPATSMQKDLFVFSIFVVFLSVYLL